MQAECLYFLTEKLGQYLTEKLGQYVATSLHTQ